ncbi:DNA polymerase I [candidate division WOR-3 bacterium]|nr:DNA polymerase I [candidate division WOR-3 bacterium]
MNTLWLIDGSSLVYRSFFAFMRNPLRNSKGENTSAVFGFVNSLLKLLNEKKPEYMLVSFDTEGPTFRHKQFKEYKATRSKMPSELKSQLPIIKEIVKHLGIKVIEQEGVEADDVIGTVAKLAESQGFEAIVFSDDKDFLQLESNDIKIFRSRDFKFVHAKDKLGIPASFVPDFLALTGDTIDNIPGVPGIGPKTAINLITQFGDLDKIFNNSSEIKNEKLKDTLEKFKEQALLSKKLTTIQTKVNVKLKLNALKIGKIDRDSLFSILKELEFFSLIKKFASLPDGQPALPASPTSQGGQKLQRGEQAGKENTPLFSKPSLYQNVVGTISNRAFETNLTDFLKAIKKTVSIAFYDSYFAFSNEKSKAFVFQVGAYSNTLLRSLMNNSSIQKIVSDSKGLFKKFDCQNVFDLSLASYLLKPEIKNHSIDNLSIVWLGVPLSEFDEKKELSESEIAIYLKERASASYSLYKVLRDELEKNKFCKLFREVESPLARVLSEMEKTGVLIDSNYFKTESNKLAVRLKKIETEIYSLTGEEFNLRSPKQIGHILFDKLKLPKSRRTKTGYSTDQRVLEELSQNYDVPKKVLEYRELFKLKSTYLDAIPKLKDSKSRIHTKWEQTVVATGRLSSTNPNLQNIPKREIRKGFIAPPNYYILSADYSQIELRILASLSKDSALIKAFNHNEDIHTKTAGLIFGISRSRVTSVERNKAKVVNFGIVYGMGPYGLSQRLKISVEKASNFIASYFLMYPGVKQWINQKLEKAHQDGYVETLLGRKRWLKGINSSNANVREFEERVAINAPIQGSAADMIKIAMIRIYEHIKDFKSNMIIQVHDELVFEVFEKEIDRIKKIIRDEMEHALKLEVPVVVDIGIGKNWYKAH